MDASTLNEQLGKVLKTCSASDFPRDTDWSSFVEQVLAMLKGHLDEGFEVDPEPVFNQHGFSMWLFAEKPSTADVPTIWSGVLSGQFLDEGGINVGFCQFVFDVGRQERLRTSGGDLIVHVLNVESDGRPAWANLGWDIDEYDEWDGVPFPDEDL